MGPCAGSLYAAECSQPSGTTSLCPQKRGELGGLHLCGECGPWTYSGCRAPFPRHSLGWQGKAPASPGSAVDGPPYPPPAHLPIFRCIPSVILHLGRPALGSHWVKVEPRWSGVWCHVSITLHRAAEIQRSDLGLNRDSGPGSL